MELKDKEELPSVYKLAKEFARITALHGVGHAFTTGGTCRRTIWRLLFVFSVVLGSFMLTDVVKDFYRYPVKTVINMKHEAHTYLPAITICNLNPLRKSWINESVKDEVLFLQKTQKPGDYADALNFIVTNISRGIRFKAGFSMNDMLITCMFNGKSCSGDNFNYTYAAVRGSCNTFKSSAYGKTHAGPRRALAIEMSIFHNEYTSLAAQAGIKVIIHNENEAPFPEEGGILAQPGMSTRIAIKKTVTQRLPSPYGDCITATDKRNEYLSLFDEEGFTYTENACKKSCYQLSLIRKCNCCDIDLPCDAERINEIFKQDSTTKIKYCNTSFRDAKCFHEQEVLFCNGALTCLNECAPACTQTSYDAIVSTSLWPSDAYMKVLMYHANKTVLKNMTDEDFSGDVRRFVSENFLRLEIFNERLDFIEVITIPVYDWSKLLGEIGGNLGLLLGFSVFTALEVLQLCFDVAVFSIQRLYRTFTTRTFDITQTKKGLSF